LKVAFERLKRGSNRGLPPSQRKEKDSVIKTKTKAPEETTLGDCQRNIEVWRNKKNTKDNVKKWTRRSSEARQTASEKKRKMRKQQTETNGRKKRGVTSCMSSQRKDSHH